jgi:hypothetical protein
MHHLTVPLSSIRLTANEASGETARAIGLTPVRHLQPPQRTSLPPWHVAFAHPMPTPSGSHHPLPRRR